MAIITRFFEGFSTGSMFLAATLFNIPWSIHICLLSHWIASFLWHTTCHQSFLIYDYGGICIVATMRYLYLFHHESIASLYQISEMCDFSSSSMIYFTACYTGNIMLFTALHYQHFLYWLLSMTMALTHALTYLDRRWIIVFHCILGFHYYCELFIHKG